MIKKILLLFLIFCFVFPINLTLAQNRVESEVVEQQDRGVISNFLHQTENYFKVTCRIINNLLKSFKNEVERRQKIFQKEIEKRKRDLLDTSSQKISEYIKKFIDDLFERTKEKIFNPDKKTKEPEAAYQKTISF